MGQYQLWLQYREIDQQLHTELESLTRDLAQLQEQANRLEVADSSSSNLILQALAQYLKPEIQAASEPGVASNNGLPASQPALQPPQASLKPSEKNGAATHSETVSPALFAWSNLPNFDTGKIRGPDPSPTASSQAHPHSEFDLLPTDMNTFFHTHSHTAPQLKLPWWLRNTTLVAHQQASEPVGAQHSVGQIDQQSMRTNQLVQRWLVRWRKRSGDVPDSQEVQR
ncbi:MAG TPA: hypothetical protein VFU49_17910 [Ktedonobacteraceae bacterium]|nr:hypothetical protein [Ktedonobacteraceae bacterium]